MAIRYRTALVTGASRGIGAAISGALVAEGLTVFAVARSADGLAALSEKLGPELRTVACDARDHQAIAAALEGVELDVLVNNAGALASVRALHEQAPEETASTVALNLVAPLQLMQAFLPGMVARRRGHIFNLTSVAGQSALQGTAVYGAAKAALAHASHVLRYELAGSNVRVTEIAPGRVETDFYLEAFEGDRTTLKTRLYASQRALHPEDVASALVSALRMPERADVARITLSPTDQAFGGHVFPDAHPSDA